jgi:hypothetical protein
VPRPATVSSGRSSLAVSDSAGILSPG